MFEKSRKKIVFSIMSILVVLWVGTLGVIYISSYIEMTKQNEGMLKAHSEIILTGHNLTEGIADVSDYISEIKEISHPYTKGVSPREGIEF